MGPDAGLVLLTHEHCDHIGGLNRTPEDISGDSGGNGGLQRGNREPDEKYVPHDGDILYPLKSGEKNFGTLSAVSVPEGGSDIYGPDPLQFCNKAAGADPASGHTPGVW